MDDALTVQQLYDWARTNNCLDFKLNISIDDKYHDSFFDEGVTLKSLEKDSEGEKWLNVEVKINEL